MRRNKIITAMILCCVLCLSLSGCGNRTKPEDFTRAVLNLRMQGEADELAVMMKDRTRGELLEEYEKGIAVFNEGYITGGLEMSDSMSGQYYDLCEEIFRSMRYQVKSAEETEQDSFQVTVEITPADVFVKYLPKLAEESEQMLAEAQAGGYEGSAEEINEQLKQDFSFRAYELLEESYLNMEYLEKQTMEILVEEDEDGNYTISDEEIWNFVIKILCIDENHD